MIFYNPQLMENQWQLTLFLVNNPVPFNNFEDHQAAIHLKLSELIESALKEGEHPIRMIEDYLSITYSSGTTVDEIANFNYHTHFMQSALYELRENWEEMDDSLPELSVKNGSGTTREQAIEVYTEITLRSYLEALAQVYES